MIFSLAIPIFALVLAVAWFLGRRRAVHRGAAPALVANSAWLTRLPAYRRAMTRHRRLAGAFVAVLVVATLAAGVVAAQPVRTHLESQDTPPTGTKDIVLCLDVSTSMDYYNEKIVDTLLEIVGKLNGERVGMSIFNSTSRTLFPLTDDYDLVTDELTYVKHILDIAGKYNMTDEEIVEYLEFYEPVVALPDQASLVPDGLASCALLFDSAPTKRSRTVILATDNEVNGTPIFTLAQAAKLVSDRGAVLDGLYVDPFNPEATQKSAAEEYEQAVQATGGTFYSTNDPHAVTDIIEKIASQQTAALAKPPELVYTDRPSLAVLVAALAVGLLLLLGWRLRT